MKRKDRIAIYKQVQHLRRTDPQYKLEGLCRPINDILFKKHFEIWTNSPFNRESWHRKSEHPPIAKILPEFEEIRPEEHDYGTYWWVTVPSEVGIRLRNQALAAMLIIAQNKPHPIETDEWYYKGCYIQRNEHPKLSKYVVFRDTEAQETVGACNTMAEAKTICRANAVQQRNAKNGLMAYL